MSLADELRQLADEAEEELAEARVEVKRLQAGVEELKRQLNAALSEANELEGERDRAEEQLEELQDSDETTTSLRVQVRDLLDYVGLTEHEWSLARQWAGAGRLRVEYALRVTREAA